MEWVTLNSAYPGAHIEYQETLPGEPELARVLVDGREVVSPSSDTMSVYRQFWSRFDAILDGEES